MSIEGGGGRGRGILSLGGKGVFSHKNKQPSFSLSLSNIFSASLVALKQICKRGGGRKVFVRSFSPRQIIEDEH